MSDCKYEVYDIAFLLKKYSLRLKEMTELIHRIYIEEERYISEEFYNDEYGFTLKVMDMVNYLNNPKLFQDEIRVINSFMAEQISDEYCEIYYDDNPNYVTGVIGRLRLELMYFRKSKIPFRSIKDFLADFKLKNRSEKFKEDLIACMEEFEVEAVNETGGYCPITKAKLDTKVSFRIKR